MQNTPAAAFVGDPARRKQLEKEAAKGGYLAIFLKFDLEMVPSGLLPPVRIISYIERQP